MIYLVVSASGEDIKIHAPDIRTAINRVDGGRSGVSAQAQLPCKGEPVYAESEGRCESCSRALLAVNWAHGAKAKADPPYAQDNEGIDICLECWPEDWSWPEHFGPQGVGIKIRSTSTIVEVDGVKARVWEGTSEEGCDVMLLVVRVAVPAGQDQDEFDRLIECSRPAEDTEAWPEKMKLGAPLSDIDAIESTDREDEGDCAPGEEAYASTEVAIALSLYAYNVGPGDRAERLYAHFKGECAGPEELLSMMVSPRVGFAATELAIYVAHALERYGEEARTRVAANEGV